MLLQKRVAALHHCMEQCSSQIASDLAGAASTCQLSMQAVADFLRPGKLLNPSMAVSMMVAAACGSSGAESSGSSLLGAWLGLS